MDWTNELLRYSHLIWTRYKKGGNPYYRFVATSVDGVMREWTTRKTASPHHCNLEFFDQGNVLQVTWHHAKSGRRVVDEWFSSDITGVDLEADFEARVESLALDESLDAKVAGQPPLRL